MNDAEALELATTYAPVFAQKVMREWKVADQIAPVDFAVPGDLTQVADNPDALHALPEDALIPAKVYYGVCETTTHYFLTYAVYHVLDWWKRYTPDNLFDFIRDQLDEHVHDMEGALLVVTKEPRGLVDAVVTVSHKNFYLYTLPMRPSDVGEARRAYRDSLEVVKFNETVDGNIWLDKATDRVKLYIEARGHGMKGDHSGWGGGDEIWYYSPEAEPEDAGTLDDEERDTRALKYELVDIFAEGGLWAHASTEACSDSSRAGAGASSTGTRTGARKVAPPIHPGRGTTTTTRARSERSLRIRRRSWPDMPRVGDR